MIDRLCFTIALLSAGLAGFAVADQPKPNTAAANDLTVEVAELVKALDDDQFVVREPAVKRLDELVANEDLSSQLAAEFRRILLKPETSFEVRAQLSQWLKSLPQIPDEPPARLDQSEIERLVDQLSDNSYAVRVGARGRLKWAIADQETVFPLIAALKTRLADPNLGPKGRLLLEPELDHARAAWLVANPAQDRFEPVSDSQISHLIEQLVRPLSAAVARASGTHSIAQRELLDLLCREDARERVTNALAEQLANPKLDVSAAQRLREVHDWTRPAMVAEIWQQRQLQTIQHLLVGVPQQPAGAPRATHFDRIDDQVAHCVSGNSLAPGNYPVGVALPRTHPDPALGNPGIMFCLFNLPTPRRRLAYEYLANAPEEPRLGEISRRSVDAILHDKRALPTREIELLFELDAGQVSRFASTYLRTIEDQPVPASGDNDDPFASPRLLPNDSRLRHAGQASLLGMICCVLAADGTREAVPGLLEAIDAGRITPPREEAPYALPWIAALSIAKRDPWSNVDEWLAGLIERRESLILGNPGGPELGATAAALLLMRHDVAPATFDLTLVEDNFLSGLGCPGHRFVSDEMRRSVTDWWAKQRRSPGGP